jgi:hypothetical protein
MFSLSVAGMSHTHTQEQAELYSKTVPNSDVGQFGLKYEK